MVITAHGYFLQYSIDMEQGGECVLLKQYSLLPTESNHPTASGSSQPPASTVSDRKPSSKDPTTQSLTSPNTSSNNPHYSDDAMHDPQTVHNDVE